MKKERSALCGLLPSVVSGVAGGYCTTPTEYRMNLLAISHGELTIFIDETLDLLHATAITSLGSCQLGKHGFWPIRRLNIVTAYGNYRRKKI
jgi:hypothetical protein